MLQRCYNIRFELFLFTQVAILFGSVFLPPAIFDLYIAPLLFMVNLLAGLVVVSKSKRILWFFVALLIVSTSAFGIDQIFTFESATLKTIRVGCYFVFYTLVGVQIIKQVWRARQVNRTVIFGLVSGYISLGLIGSFIFTMIEWLEPGSFTGELLQNATALGREPIEALMYFSYITLLTIGYGDIVPVTLSAQKAVILVGLAGQFYLVIVSAVVVGKYISKHLPDDD